MAEQSSKPSNTVFILGIPIDSLTMTEAVDRIVQLVREYHEAGVGTDGGATFSGLENSLKQPSLVSTVNVDFLVNCLFVRHFNFRHPELVEILRRSALCTADGMPLVWLSRLVGCPLPERVAGADLVPALAERAAQEGLSLYLLGGQQATAEKAADILKSNNPSLTIAGVDSPQVYTRGEALVDIFREDEPICSAINDSGADILLVGLGNPKQELWFQRNRFRLKTPVVIGIGGTFNFITGVVPRAPKWMQKTGLEWLYRIYAEPGRLWRRYLTGFFRFGAISLPLLAYHLYLQVLGRSNEQSDVGTIAETMFLAGRHSVKVVRMAAVPRTLQRFQEMAQQGTADGLVLDFKGVDRLTLGEISDMARFAQAMQDRAFPFYITLVSSRLRRLLKLSRVYDSLEHLICRAPEQVTLRLRERWREHGCFFAFDLAETAIHIRFWGSLDTEQIAQLDIEAILSLLGQRPCVVDLAYCRFLDSSGLSFLLQLQQQQKKNGNGSVSLINLNEEVEQVLETAGVTGLFRIQ